MFFYYFLFIVTHFGFSSGPFSTSSINRFTCDSRTGLAFLSFPAIAVALLCLKQFRYAFTETYILLIDAKYIVINFIINLGRRFRG